MKNEIEVVKEALEYYDKGNYNDAGATLVELYHKQKEQGKPSELIRFHLGRVYYAVKQYDKAINILSTVIKDNPKHSSALYYVALAHEADIYAQGNLYKAKNALQHVPNNASNKASVDSLLSEIEKQIKIDDELNAYISKTDNPLNERELFKLLFIVKEIDTMNHCSKKEEFFIKIAQVYGNSRNSKYKKAIEDGLSLKDAREKSRNEIQVLDTILDQYIRRAGFNI